MCAMMSKPRYRVECIGGNWRLVIVIRFSMPNNQYPITNNIRTTRGYALLLAVVVTGAVLTTASALSSVIISEIRQTRDFGNAIQAQASAEGDLEQAMFILRKSGDDQLARGTSTVGAVTREVEEMAPVRPFTIDENDFISLSVPNNFSGDITIPHDTWFPGSNCTPPEESWIEVSRSTWDAATGTFTTDRQPHAYSESAISIAIPVNTLEVRIRALHCDIFALRVDGLLSRIRVRSTARVQGISQTVEVAIPRAAPAAGLFDFVIFSEGDITK